MFWIHFLFALILALVFAGIIASTGRKGPGPGGGFLFFLLMFILLIWAGGIWITPVGPSLWGVHWLNFFMISLVVFLVLGALIPTKPFRLRSPETARDEPLTRQETVATAAFSLFIWLLAVILIAVIAVYYL